MHVELDPKDPVRRCADQLIELNHQWSQDKELPAWILDDLSLATAIHTPTYLFTREQTKTIAATYGQLGTGYYPTSYRRLFTDHTAIIRAMTQEPHNSSAYSPEVGQYHMPADTTVPSHFGPMLVQLHEGIARNCSAARA